MLATVKIAAFRATFAASLWLFAALLQTRFFLFAIDLLHLHDERHFALRQADNRVLCADADIDAPAFADELLHLIDDAAVRDAMRQAARGLAQDRAAALLADAVEGLR